MDEVVARLSSALSSQVWEEDANLGQERAQTRVAVLLGGEGSLLARSLQIRDTGSAAACGTEVEERDVHLRWRSRRILFQPWPSVPTH